MKSPIRSAKASGSTRRRVAQIIRAGWEPGLPTVPFYRRNAQVKNHAPLNWRGQ